MAILSTTRALMAAFLLPVFSVSAASIAQTSTTQKPPPAPCPVPNQTPDQTAKPCPPPAAKKPSIADEHPFPGDAPKSATPPAPDSPTPTVTPGEAAAQHPFPTQPPPKLPGDDSSSSSSSSSDDPSATPPGATPPGDTPTPGGDPPEGTSVHRKLPKVKRVQSDDERVDEDLSVSKFYLHDENYDGAYLRAKDAVQIQPEYSATHFALAQVLQKMKKNDEAIAEYKTYLKLDPDGEKAKDAKKALADLQ
jgi:hypothetical protein